MGTKKITVTALTSGATDPSSRFRIRQYIEPLALNGIEVKEFCPLISKYAILPYYLSRLGLFSKLLITVPKLLSRVTGLINSHKTQVTWINRELIPGRSSLINWTGGIRVFDIDDAVWVGGERLETRIQEILKTVDVVFAGNKYLADWCRQYCSHVHIIPTSVDTKRFTPLTKRNECLDFVVGWTGTQYTIQYLYGIETALKKFFDNCENATLLVVSDKPPKETFLKGCKIRWIKWTPEVEAFAIQEMDAGIMPLPKDHWTMGKCSFKMIQYMASGIPSVVSPVGMNEMILSLDKVGFAASNDDDWVESISKLYADRELCAVMGKSARRLVLKRFSLDVVAHDIARIFSDLVGPKC